MRLCGCCSFLCIRCIFELLTGTISVTLPGDPPAGSSSPATTGPNAGVIAGATVGGCIALLGFVGALFWYHRRRRAQLKALEPLPLMTTNRSAPAAIQQQTREVHPSLAPAASTMSHVAVVEFSGKAEYRGGAIPSPQSGSGSSGIASPTRNIPSTIYLSPQSHHTVPTSPHSPHPHVPPPSYAAAAGDVQIHEVGPDPPE
jgi:hypothetical protein